MSFGDTNKEDDVFDRLKVLADLEDILYDATITNQQLSFLVDYIEDNFIPKAEDELI